MVQDTKLIFKASIARALLKKNNTIVDIKENRNVKGSTVFVFENNAKFQNDLNEIISDKKNATDKE